MKKSSLALLLAVVLIAGALWNNRDVAGGYALSVKVSDETAPRVGYMAPSFELETIDQSGTLQVGGKRDKILFLNFWASWCGPCQAEAPDLVQLYAKYKDDMDMYAVNVTNTGDTAAKALAFANEYHMINPILMDYKGDVFKSYNGIAFPTNFIIDRDGVIREAYIGLRPAKEMEKAIQALINEK